MQEEEEEEEQQQTPKASFVMLCKRLLLQHLPPSRSIAKRPWRLWRRPKRRPDLQRFLARWHMADETRCHVKWFVKESVGLFDAWVPLFVAWTEAFWQVNVFVVVVTSCYLHAECINALWEKTWIWGCLVFWDASCISTRWQATQAAKDEAWSSLYMVFGFGSHHHFYHVLHLHLYLHVYFHFHHLHCFHHFIIFLLLLIIIIRMFDG